MEEIGLLHGDEIFEVAQTHGEKDSLMNNENIIDEYSESIN